MMKNLCAVSFLVASLYAGNVYAQPAAVKKIIEIGTTDNRVMHQLDVLTNRFGGRPIGSDAYDNAAEWMLREFRSWGIEAHLEEAGELPVGFNRGPWFGRRGCWSREKMWAGLSIILPKLIQFAMR